MSYVNERIRLGIFKDDIYNDIEYIDYLMCEYKGRVKFYIKEEVNKWKKGTKTIYNRLKLN